MYDFAKLEARRAEVLEWLKGEYIQLQTGNATPLLLDKVSVDVYGAKTPIVHVANVNIEDPKTLLISPWDTSLITSIEKAVRDGLPNFSLSVGEKTIRVKVPELTGERRDLLKALIREKLEEAKKSFRPDREKIINDLKDKQKNKEISEDDASVSKEKLQDIVSKFNKELEEISEKKLKDIEA